MKFNLFLAALFALGGVILFFLLSFIFHPLWVMSFDPKYKEAERICNSVQVGASYEEILETYGDLVYEPTAYINKETGGGMVDLENDVNQLSTSCRINFKDFKVIGTSMGYTWF